MVVKGKLREILIMLKKVTIQMKLHLVKTILIILCIASFSFVLIQNYSFLNAIVIRTLALPSIIDDQDARATAHGDWSASIGTDP